MGSVSKFIMASLVASSVLAQEQEDELAIIGKMQYCQEAKIFYQHCMPQDAEAHEVFERNLTEITRLA